MTTPAEPSRPPESRMSFMQHLGELRRRLWYAVLGVTVVSIFCFTFSAELFEFLRMPLAAIDQKTLIVLSPLELYVTYIKLAILASLFVSSPWVLYQLWLFVSPGLYGHEKRWVVPFVALGSMFFTGGAAFAFYVVLPMGFKY